MKHYVYFLYNLDEDLLLYIGRAINPEERRRDFIRREGVSAVLTRVIEFESFDAACASELANIEQLKPLYNQRLVSVSGMLGKSHSDVTKERLRESSSGRPWHGVTGFKHSAEEVERMRARKVSLSTIEKIRKKATGRRHTEVTKDKLRAARIERVQTCLTLESTRKKMSDAHRGKVLSAEHRLNISKSRYASEERKRNAATSNSDKRHTPDTQSAGRVPVEAVRPPRRRIQV